MSAARLGALLMATVGLASAGALAGDECWNSPGLPSVSVPAPPPSDCLFVVDTPDPSGNYVQMVDELHSWRLGPWITIDIPVNRYAGSVDSNEHLTKADVLVANGLAERYAELTIMAYDVDSNAPGWRPEVDTVFFNGVWVRSLVRQRGHLTGLDRKWTANKFLIPLNQVRFPGARGSNGQPPTPAVNRVNIYVDSSQNGHWCTAVGWVSLRIRVMSPVFLIHGVRSEPAYFNVHGFIDRLDEMGVVWDNRIGFPPNGASASDPNDRVSNNADRMHEKLPDFVPEYGVRKYHLVAHSKGGLDSRDYLARYGPHDFLFNRKISSLSLTTIATPHAGSVLADLSWQAHLATQLGIRLDFDGLPFQQQLATEMYLSAYGLSPGFQDLQTFRAAEFNTANAPQLPSRAAYSTILADADRDYSLTINLNIEWWRMRFDDPTLQNDYDWVNRLKFDRLYHILARYRAATARWGTTFCTYDVPPYFGWERTLVVDGIHTEYNLWNDLLVAKLSARGDGGYRDRVSQSAFLGNALELYRNDGRNHSDVTDEQSASAVAPWLRRVDSNRMWGK